MRTEPTGDMANPISPVEAHNRRLMETVGRLRQVAAALEIIEERIVGGFASYAGEFAELKPLEGMAPMIAADYAMDAMHILVDRMARGPIQAMALLIGHSQLVPFDPEPRAAGMVTGSTRDPADQWRPDRDAPSTRGPLQQGRDSAAEQKAARIKAEIAAKQEAAAAGEVCDSGDLRFHTRERGSRTASWRPTNAIDAAIGKITGADIQITIMAADGVLVTDTVAGLAAAGYIPPVGADRDEIIAWLDARRKDGAPLEQKIAALYGRGSSPLGAPAADQETKPELPTDHPAMKKARSLAEVSREFEKLAGRQITDTELRMVADWLTDRLENAK